MVWELVAIWLIVMATLAWFVRDERRLRFEQLAARARQFATAAAWRHREAAPPPPPPAPVQRDLTEIQRKFIEELQQRTS